MYGGYQKFFHYKIGKKEEKIPFSEIMYFVCEQRKICIVTKRDRIYYYENMKELHRRIQNAQFWSVHFSYIINVKYVEKFRSNEIIMSDDYVVPISKAYKEKVKMKILHLDEGNSNHDE